MEKKDKPSGAAERQTDREKIQMMMAKRDKRSDVMDRRRMLMDRCDRKNERKREGGWRLRRSEVKKGGQKDQGKERKNEEGKIKHEAGK